MSLSMLDESLFKTKFWKPTQGKKHVIDVVGSQIVYTDFGGREDTKVPVIELSISAVDNEVYSNPLTFSSQAISFLKDFIPINNDWHRAGQTKIRVMIHYNSDNKYTVLDLTEQLANQKAVEEAVND